jgi:hypothetical protein
MHFARNGTCLVQDLLDGERGKNSGGPYSCVYASWVHTNHLMQQVCVDCRKVLQCKTCADLTVSQNYLLQTITFI